MRSESRGTRCAVGGASCPLEGKIFMLMHQLVTDAAIEQRIVVAIAHIWHYI